MLLRGSEGATGSQDPQYLRVLRVLRGSDFKDSDDDDGNFPRNTCWLSSSSRHDGFTYAVLVCCVSVYIEIMVVSENPRER